jgi:hypothetical protein
VKQIFPAFLMGAQAYPEFILNPAAEAAYNKARNIYDKIIKEADQ